MDQVPGVIHMKMTSADGSLRVEVVTLEGTGNLGGNRTYYQLASLPRDGENFLVTESHGFVVGYYQKVEDLPEPLRRPGLRIHS